MIYGNLIHVIYGILLFELESCDLWHFIIWTWVMWSMAFYHLNLSHVIYGIISFELESCHLWHFVLWTWVMSSFTLLFQYLCVDFFQINKLHQMSLQQGIPIIPTSQPLLPSKYKNTTVEYWISQSDYVKHFILPGNSLFTFNFSSGTHCIGSVMVSMLASSVVNHGFEPWGCQTDYKNWYLLLLCLSTLCWRSKCKDWLTCNQVFIGHISVPDWLKYKKRQLHNLTNTIIIMHIWHHQKFVLFIFWGTSLCDNMKILLGRDLDIFLENVCSIFK